MNCESIQILIDELETVYRDWTRQRHLPTSATETISASTTTTVATTNTVVAAAVGVAEEEQWKRPTEAEWNLQAKNMKP